MKYIISAVSAVLLTLTPIMSFSGSILATSPPLPSPTVADRVYESTLGDKGIEVLALQTAMSFFVSNGVIKVYDPPNSPSADQISTLHTAMLNEMSERYYGDATRQLVLIFQIQQGLGDNLHGVTESSTAAAMNATLQLMGGQVRIQVGQPLTCSIVKLPFIRKPSVIRIKLMDTMGNTVIDSNRQNPSPGEVQAVTDTTYQASWCLFELSDDSKNYRGGASYGEKDGATVLFIPAQ